MSRTPIDPAALAAATLAAAVAVMAEDGAYDIWSMMIATTLGLLLYAHHDFGGSSPKKSAAFVGVAAFILTIFVAYPREMLAARNGLEGTVLANGERDSAIPDLWLLGAWVFWAAAVAVLEWKARPSS